MTEFQVTCIDEGYQQEPKVKAGNDYTVQHVFTGQDIDVHNGDSEDLFYLLKEMGDKNVYSKRLFKNKS